MKCANCGEPITDCYASVIVDKDDSTEIWCGDCIEACSWTCSVCFEPFSYDVEAEFNANWEHVCKKCFKGFEEE